jgi:hypothetical protein
LVSSFWCLSSIACDTHCDENAVYTRAYLWRHWGLCQSCSRITDANLQFPLVAGGKRRLKFQPELLSISDAGVNAGIWSWKKDLSQWARCQVAIDGIYFTKNKRADTLRPGLEFDKYKHRLKSCIFKSISWLYGLFFGVDDRGFVQEGVKNYLMAPMSNRNWSNFFLSSHL